ncbi:hypothetical protein IQ283_08485 (plasmid) [Alkalihalobacillus hwajinpoensis]|uniref:hypothetical protein n=1 Tax=Guptibacillus hwajinpoensis TaxID=208199 RepID=UPI001883BB8C|nr:hypothetical protein [Pseudalkalibacillus hwajinpoensis]MBF0706646.1 hypothetical protein [Pseudalkalibacillus hwajinpoensis]
MPEYKTIETDETKEYFSVFAAMEDQGYIAVGKVYIKNVGKASQEKTLFRHGRDLYYFVSCSHQNNTFYNVRIRNIIYLKEKPVIRYFDNMNG